VRKIATKFSGGLLAAILVSSFAPTGSAYADTPPGSKHGTEHIHNCGVVTCSDYYSHDATVRFDAVLQGSGLDTASQGADVCSAIAAFAAAAEPPCLMLHAATGTLDRVKDIVHHAATSNGCMRFQSPKGVSAINFAVYADHSDTCHSMD